MIEEIAKKGLNRPVNGRQKRLHKDDGTGFTFTGAIAESISNSLAQLATECNTSDLAQQFCDLCLTVPE